MSTKVIIPSTSSVEPTFEMLFGDDLDVSVGNVDEAAGQTERVAIYVDDDSKVIAACGCDNYFAAYSGASLTRIPADVAKEAADDNDFSAMMSNNFYEVMNICSKLLMDDHSTHLRLDKVFHKDEMGSAMEGMSAYASFHVDIPRYGLGKIAFFSIAA